MSLTVGLTQTVRGNKQISLDFNLDSDSLFSKQLSIYRDRFKHHDL